MTNNEPTIQCPKCHTEIKLTESLSAPMVERVRQEMQSRIDIAISQAEEVKRKADDKEAHLEEELKARMHIQREQADLKARTEAEAASRAQLEDLEQQLLQQRVKLSEAQKGQAEALRRERDLEERERELALTVERQVNLGIETARQSARREADEAARLKLLEKDTLLHSMEVKVAELQQKLIQGSQQAQGEALELDIEAQLRQRFPRDEFAEVGKGVRGADITHRVMASSGVVCGTIIYELKRTKTFSQGWLPKLRSDGREANADALVLVSQALPDDVEQFALLDGIWVCRAAVLHPLVDALRAGLLNAQAVRQAAEGEATQAEAVYRYLTGSRFKARIEASIEAWSTMQTDLEAEKRAMQRQWAKRAAQIDVVIASTTGLFGDLEAVGRMPEIEGLSMKALGEGGE